MIGRIIGNLLLLVIIVAVAYYGLKYLPSGSLNNLTNITHGVNLSYTTVPQTTIVPQNQSVAYILSLINNDRQQGGAQVVTDSNITSAQQHADSMLQFGYFSHWDPFDLKPYMRYTAVGGKGSVDENVAYIYNSSGVNVLQDLQLMEHNFVYNDFQCCNNGHKYNILDPTHNQVSIGIAYNATTIYLVEDFVNNYISWVLGTPSYSDGAVTLQGVVPQGYSLSTVEVTYDNPLVYQSVAQLDNTTSYSYGQTVAGIGYTVGDQNYFFPNMTTINASTYEKQGNNFNVQFSMQSLISKYGPGEYTVVVWISNSTSGTNSCFTNQNGVVQCSSFIAATYTIFINNAEQSYIPQSI